MAIILANICAIRYEFIDIKFSEIICQVLEIESQRFDGRSAKLITHAIYPTLTIGTHSKIFDSLFITKWGNHLTTLDQP